MGCAVPPLQDGSAPHQCSRADSWWSVEVVFYRPGDFDLEGTETLESGSSRLAGRGPLLLSGLATLLVLGMARLLPLTRPLCHWQYVAFFLLLLFFCV